MIDHRTASVSKVLLVSQALVPILLFAYLGQFNRMISDDYCYISGGRTLGPLNNLIVQRNIWNGSYSDYFMRGMLGPLDWEAVRILPAATILIWLFGMVWLMWQALGLWHLRRNRLTIAVICASLLLAATINAFYSKETIFYYSAHMRYTLPLAMFTVFLAAVLEATKRLSTRPSCATAAFASVVFCFVNAGFSEMYLVFQLTMLLVLLGATYLLVERLHRRLPLLLLSAGLLGTIASAVTVLTAPGVAIRAEKTLNLVAPVRALPELIQLSIGRASQYLIDQYAFAGFALLFALGLVLAQILHEPRWVDPRPKRIRIASAPLWMGLAIQLCFVPFLWAHTSDTPQFFGRFSLSYMTVICLNLALICGYLTLLWRRSRFSASLYENRNHLVLFAGLTLLAVLALFMLTQLRSINYKAAGFLYLSAMVSLAYVSIQLSLILSNRIAKRWWWVIITCLGAALMCSVILSLFAFYGVGFIGARYMGSVAILQISAGLLWGALVGSALGSVLRDSGALSAKVLVFRVVPLLVVLTIGIGIVAAQLSWIPDLQSFASEWDARHQYIVEQRDSGQRQIETWMLSYDLSSEFRNISSPRSQSYENNCAANYYGVESIKLADT